MVITSLDQVKVGDTVYVGGIPFILNRIIGSLAYVTKYHTKGTKTYLLQPEGTMFTVSEVVGDRTLPWFVCGTLHYLKKLDPYPGLE